jgi:hypothetical protein
MKPDHRWTGKEEALTHCRFRTSLGGTRHCQDTLYRDGFCRFHFECYLRGEVLANGQVNEALGDQDRRRTINFHGIPAEEPLYLLED